MYKIKQANPTQRRFSDPLEAWAYIPPNETPEQKEQRLMAEYAAKKRSDVIDEEIRQDRNERRRPRDEVKLLLLGQSESGKSTTLKQFQLLHTPAAFHAERVAWRAVIYLNLVRSVRRILDAISPDALLDEEAESGEAASIIISSHTRPLSVLSGTRVPKYESYRQRLEPLAELEERLIRLLSAPEEDEATRLGPSNGGAWEGSHAPPPGIRPTPSITIPEPRPHSSPVTPVNGSRNRNKEVVIHNNNTNWKKAFSLGRSRSPKNPHGGELEGWWEDVNDPVHVLNACAPAMQELWHDAHVRDRLEEKRLRLEESSGFFLDDIRRITALMYIPKDEDVLRARLKTMGVVEHRFTVSTGTTRGIDWKIYDVGGARSQRAAWIPYFEDVNAILFLAPISAFDQVLAEDPRVNRLEDSLLLWKSVVSNKLLQKINLILFLNKTDLLQAKLKAGVRLNQHMVTYGDRPNDYETISKYFRNKFGAIHQSFTPNKDREWYIHFTSVTDTRHTSIIIANVRDIIVKDNLKTLKLV